MPTMLHELESGIGLMGYYCEFVLWYSIIADPLLEIKTMGLQGAPIKNLQRKKFALTCLLPLPLPEKELGLPANEQAKQL